jgi:hypothetical protein
MVDYKKVIVTEVDEDLRFYAQFVDNGMLSFKSFFFVYGQTLFNKKSSETCLSLTLYIITHIFVQNRQAKLLILESVSMV